MFQFITDLSHTLLEFIKDDPVRPEISKDFRVSDGRMVAALTDEEQNPEAMVCVSFHDFIPADVKDLDKTAQVPTTAIFYTIWSYSSGAARKLIFAVRDQLPPTIKKMVTLSPQTEMARRFHESNGAVLIRENLDTWNFEYSLEDCLNRNPGPRCEAA